MIISPKTARSTFLPGFGSTVAALALLLFAVPVGVASGQATSNSTYYQELKVPAGNRLVLSTIGVGVQIYSWNGTTWTFEAPEATLFVHDEVVAFHFAGPTWESLGGSQVVGSVLLSRTPNPEAIPWLLLKAASNEGRGIFRQVTYIQRLNTVGGLAPTAPGTYVNEVARVSYAARYLFYKKG